MWFAALALTVQHRPPETRAVVELYVASDGNDAWSGFKRRPTRDHRNGPLRTLQAALNKAAATPVNGDFDVAVVRVEPGRYRIERPLVVNGGRVVVSPAGNGRVEVNGARQVTGWRVDERGWWHASLPDVAAGRWNFIQLWVNGQRRYRPRSTHEGYALVERKVDASSPAAGKGFNRFGYHLGDIDPTWSNLRDIEVLPFHNWSMGRFRIESVDPVSRTVTLAGHTASTADWSSLSPANRYIVENVREALGRPGDWYLDRKRGELTYVPEKGETPTNCDVEAPIADSLLAVNRGMSLFSGIDFAYTNWATPADGHDFPQADIDVSAAIQCGGGCSYPRFNQCRVEHTGGYAISFGPDCWGGFVDGCVLYDLGGGGVKIGSTAGNAQTQNIANVRESIILSGGRLHPASVGVWIGDAAANTVVGNRIGDFYYTGVSVGWTWGYGPAHSGNNLIAHNEISDIGQHVLSDMGGIYTLGNQTGTKLEANVIHDVNCFAYGGWGIYPDEGTTNEDIEHNIVYRCNSAGFHQHYGKDNKISNNVFGLNGDFELMRTRAEDHNSFTFDHNIVVWASGEPFGGNWQGNGFVMHDNLYWHYGNRSGNLPQDPASRIVDPLFIEPLHGNFKLKPSSVALQLGFDNHWLGQTGPSTNSPSTITSVRSPARAPRAFPDPFAKK